MQDECAFVVVPEEGEEDVHAAVGAHGEQEAALGVSEPGSKTSA